MQSITQTMILEAFQIARPTLEQLLPEATAQFFAMVEEKKAAQKPTIIVYGIYNHGKSTLINALIGTDEAEYGEGPKTDRPQGYSWRGYTIIDTPGIDAPIEHEQIAEEQLRKSEIVLFVMDSGSNELSKIQELLVSIVKSGQHVYLIVNDSTGCMNDAAKQVRIKDAFGAKLQQEATNQGVADILDKVPMFFVNAKTALKAKKEQKNNLIGYSGILFLEEELEKFFKSLPEGEQWQTLIRNFLILCEQGKAKLTNEKQDFALQEAQKRLTKIEQTENELCEDIAEELNKRLLPLKRDIHQILESCQSQEDAPIKLAPVMETFSVSFGDFCKSRFEEATGQVEKICLAHDAQVNEFYIEHGNTASDTVSIMGGAINTLPWKDLLEKLGWENMAKDGVVQLLKFAKEIFPDVFKGIGIKTMGKWAGTLSKWLGPAMIVLTALYDFYQNLQAEKAAREAAERKARMLGEATQSIIEGTREDFLKETNKLIKQIFKPLKAQCQDAVDALLANDESTMRNLHSLTTAQDIATQCK